LLFGHSTNWQVVQNEAFKTFNGLEDLKNGDEIFLESDGRTFIYKVRKVSLLDENQAEVKLNVTERILTISRC
jgi:sortase (surface protein transpeptidase)